MNQLGGVSGQTKREIGDLLVDVVSSDRAKDEILLAMRRGNSRLVTFANAHTVNIARNDPALREALEPALVLNDGVGIELASKILHGQGFLENLNGTDFCPSLLDTAGCEAKLFLLGGDQGIAERAARTIAARFPEVSVVGTRHGYFDAGESPRIIAEAKAAGANLIFVGMGQPKQEVWAARHSPEFPGAVICVGACIDFLAGKFPRAPRLVRQMRLEWAYRLMQEPRRLARRYLVGNLVFIHNIMREKIRIVLDRNGP